MERSCQDCRGYCISRFEDFVVGIQSKLYNLFRCVIRCKLLCEGLMFSLQDEPRGMACAIQTFLLCYCIKYSERWRKNKDRVIIGIQETKNKHGKQCFSLSDSSNGSTKHELCICTNKTTTASRTELWWCFQGKKNLLFHSIFHTWYYKVRPYIYYNKIYN
jgi:hypothetical protein